MPDDQAPPPDDTGAPSAPLAPVVDLIAWKRDRDARHRHQFITFAIVVLVAIALLEVT